MPLSVVTRSAVFTAQFAEVAFGSISPTFDEIDVYVQADNAQAIRTTWTLYAVTGSVKSLVAKVGPISGSSGPTRIIATHEPLSADVYELYGSAADPVGQPFAAQAGLVGYDLVINDSPAITDGSAQTLVFGEETVFANIGVYRNNLQVEVNLAETEPYGESLWTLYAIVTGPGVAIRAPVASATYVYSPSASQQLILFHASSIGASSYQLAAKALNPKIGTIGSARAVGQLTAFSQTIDGATGPAAQTAVFETLPVTGAFPTFMLSEEPAPDSVQMFVNGVLYRPVTDYSVSGKDVTWNGNFPLTAWTDYASFVYQKT